MLCSTEAEGNNVVPLQVTGTPTPFTPGAGQRDRPLQAMHSTATVRHRQTVPLAPALNGATRAARLEAGRGWAVGTRVSAAMSVVGDNKETTSYRHPSPAQMGAWGSSRGRPVGVFIRLREG